MKILITIVVSAVFLMVSATVNAGIVITSNDSYLEVESYVEDTTGANDFDADYDAYTDTSIPGGFSNNLFSSASISSADSMADTFMDVIIDNSFSPLYMEIGMSATASAETFSSDSEAFGFADSILDITFVTDEAYEFLFGAEFIAAFGSAAAEIFLTNSSGDALLDILVLEDVVFPFETFLASPDEYHLTIAMTAYVDLFGEVGMVEGSADGLMFLEATPVVVPVPAAVWLLGSGLIGLAGIVRRRA